MVGDRRDRQLIGIMLPADVARDCMAQGAATCEASSPHKLTVRSEISRHHVPARQTQHASLMVDIPQPCSVARNAQDSGTVHRKGGRYDSSAMLEFVKSAILAKAPYSGSAV